MPFPTLLKSGALVFGLCTFLAPSLSVADPIDPSLSIVGTNSLFDTDPDLATSTWSAALYSLVSGVNTAGASTSVALTETGDGFGHTAALSGDNFTLTQLGGNYTVTASNSSTDTFKLTFGITFAHTADSGGVDLDADARSVSELELTDAADSEYLFSRLTSENGQDYHDAGNPTWQDQIHDEVSDTYLGTWGDALSFGETRYFHVELTGGASFDINGVFDVDGRTFDSGANYSTTSQMFLFLHSVVNLTNTDSDGDGISDADDNCMSIANPLQEPSTLDPNCGKACNSGGFCGAPFCVNH
jgi:hypothetical protein